jgi:hypothetical protein
VERIIIVGQSGVQDTAYLADLLDAIEGADSVVYSATFEGGREVRCEISVRRYTDPRWLLTRWAMVLAGDEYEVRDYATKGEAMEAYKVLVRRCAVDGVVWDITKE